MSRDALDRPIFLMSAGRSGSTLLHRILSSHPSVGTPISWTNRFPSLPWLGFGARLRIHSWERRGWHPRFYPGPSEAEGMWLSCFPRLWHCALRELAPAAEAQRFRALCRRLLRAQRRSRLLIKLSGPAIFPFARRVLPGVRCLWLDRDPRAIVCSYLEKGWLGAEEATADSELAGLDRAIDNFLKTHACRQRAAADLTIRYEDFVAAPLAQCRALLDALELESTPRFLKRVAAWRIATTANDGWRRRLPEGARRHLNQRLAEPLEDLDYR